MSMFRNQSPKFIPSSQYAGKCLLCEQDIGVGDPIYWQHKRAKTNPTGKAAVWHKSCYEQFQTQSEPFADPYHGMAQGEPGQGSGQQASGGQVGGQASGQSQGQGQGPESQSQQGSAQQTPENGENSQGTNSEENSVNEENQSGGGEPRLRDEISGLWFDGAKMSRHLHRDDIIRLVRHSVMPRVGGEAVSQVRKAEMVEAVVRRVEQICDRHERLDELEEWLQSHTKRDARILRRADERLSAMLLQKRAQQAPATPQAPAPQSGSQGVSEEMHQAAVEAERRKAQVAQEEAAKAKAEAEEALRLAEEAEEKSRTIEIKRPDGSTQRIEGQHERFGDLLALVSAGLSVLMVGPAGGGKTEAARKVAEAIEAENFTPLSLGPQTTQASVFGYCSATGDYVSTPFRRAYEGGGLILLDELDRCNERVSVTLNAAIANGRCAFPDGTVDRHPQCYIIAAANTTGHGADRQYVSARQQDAALLDRFAVLDWQYDLAFETALTRQLCAEHADEWLATVRRVRARAEELGLRYVVSPRASLQGATLLAAGVSRKLAVETVLFRGWSDDDRSKVESVVEVN